MKAHHKGTLASKKKKQAKLQRAIRSMKRHQRLSSRNSNTSYYSPLNHLKDAQVCQIFLLPLSFLDLYFSLLNQDSRTSESPCDLLQGFAERLFSRLQNCNERFEVLALTKIKHAFLLHDKGVLMIHFYVFPCLLFSTISLCAQVKMMMLKVISRTVGLHRLILLNLYPFLQKYVQVSYLINLLKVGNLCTTEM